MKKSALLSLLLVLVSWDVVLHNCGNAPWTDDLARYEYRVTMRVPIDSVSCGYCDEGGACFTMVCFDYSPFQWPNWSSVASSDAACSRGSCAVLSSDGSPPAPGEVLFYEVEAEDRAGNADCGPAF